MNTLAGAPTQTFQLISSFIRSLEGRNMSRLTLVAYETDIRQFFTWVQENDVTVTSPGQVTRSHIIEYLSHLADLGRSGVTRARKLAAVKAFFAYLVATGMLTQSLALKVSIPKKEKKEPVFLRVDEYMRLLSDE